MGRPKLQLHTAAYLFSVGPLRIQAKIQSFFGAHHSAEPIVGAQEIALNWHQKGS